MLFLYLFSQNVLTDRLVKKDVLECNVMELQHVEGLGTTVDILLVNGTLRKGDKIILCGFNGPIITKIRSIITPEPSEEFKGNASFSSHVTSVTGAMGIKIWAKDLDTVVSGSRLFVATGKDDINILQNLVMEPLESIRSNITVGGSGVHVQASTLGSLEALLDYLRSKSVAVSTFNIGVVNVRDVKKASFGEYAFISI